MTQIFGVVGDPVQHSLSPVIFAAAFKAAGIDAEYKKFLVKPEELKDFLERARKELSGLSITIPHKEAILPLLDEIDERARDIGAVNTVKISDGKLSGYNTDWEGALQALQENTSLSGKDVVILGAGGAAAAIVYACAQAGTKVTILNRTLEKAQQLAQRFSQLSNLHADHLQNLKNYSADVLIQTTSVGMAPNVNESLVPAEYLQPHMTVMDIVYTPQETKLLKDAKLKGCTIIAGSHMFLNQATKQFELWFGKKPSQKMCF